MYKGDVACLERRRNWKSKFRYKNIVSEAIVRLFLIVISKTFPEDSMTQAQEFGKNDYRTLRTAQKFLVKLSLVGDGSGNGQRR